jgi:hypothetical protein
MSDGCWQPFTLDTYAHVVPGMQADPGAGLSRA